MERLGALNSMAASPTAVPATEAQAASAVDRKSAPYANLRSLAMGPTASPPPDVLAGALRMMPWHGQAPFPLMNPAVIRELTKEIMDPDVKWYRYAAGAMGPTKSGGFGEGMANAMSGFADAKTKEAELRAQYMPLIAQSLLASQQAYYAQMEKQQALTKQWNDVVSGRLISLLPRPTVDAQGTVVPGELDPKMARGEILDLMVKGQVPPDFGMMYIKQLPEDPREAYEHVKRLHVSSLAPNERTGELFGKPMQVGAGGQTVLGTQGPISPPRAQAVVPHTPPVQPPGMQMTDTGMVATNPNQGTAAPVNTPGAAAVTQPPPRPPMVPVSPAGGTPSTAAPGSLAPPAAPLSPSGAPPVGGSQPGGQSSPPAAFSPPTNPTPTPVVQEDPVFRNIPRVRADALTAGAPGFGKLNPVQAKVQEAAADNFVKESAALDSTLRAEREALSRAKTIRDITDRVRTGRLAGVRGEVGAILNDLAVTLGLLNQKEASDLANRIAGGDQAAIEHFSKLAINGAMTNLRADIGTAGGSRVAQQEFMQYLNAVANPKLNVETLNRLEQDARRAYNRDVREAEARAAFLRTPGADYTQFPVYWDRLLVDQFKELAPTARTSGSAASGTTPAVIHYGRDKDGRIIVTRDPPGAAKRQWFYPSKNTLIGG